MQGRKKIHLELEEIIVIIKFNHTSQRKTVRIQVSQHQMPRERAMADIVYLESPRACFPIYLIRAPWF